FVERVDRFRVISGRLEGSDQLKLSGGENRHGSSLYPIHLFNGMANLGIIRLSMAKNALQLKYPIVLVHGLGARGNWGPVDYFFGLPGILRSHGNDFYIAKLTPWQTIDHRAQQLKDQINQVFPGEEKLNLVGHSMGGLDCRYLT